MTAEQIFKQQYPEYENVLLDKLRRREFPQIDRKTYMDWTGAALPPRSLLNGHFDFLKRNLLGNPHSHHAPSMFAMEQITETREAILKFFNAGDDYEVIFTKNATEAILVLQHYLFDSGELLLTADNHNSMNGLREIARRKGAIVRYSPINSDLTLNSESLERALSYPRSTGNKLFGYPAKSNYSGEMHSLDWVKFAQEKGWDVLLDAAAYVANNRLDLSKVRPDFVPVSFYKIFGYPTGIGCLLIKKEKYQKLHKMWFSGGSILLVSVMKDFFAPESIGYARFEDGTINFANIPAIKAGLQYFENLGNFKSRVLALTSWLHDKLNGMQGNGNSIIVHNAKGNDTVAFNVQKAGKIIDSWYFERAASKEGIFVRTGCFCDPGVNEELFQYEIEAYERFYNSAILPHQITIENLREYSGEKPIGAIRASLGYFNNFKDVQNFANFAEQFLMSLK